MSHFLSRLSIRRKMAILTAVSIILPLVIGLASIRSDFSHRARLATQVDLFTALRNHLDADMMHDALRADVLAAFMAGTDSARRAAVQEDLQKHSMMFRTALDNIRRLPLNEEIQRIAVDLRPTLEMYIHDAEAVANLAMADPKSAQQKFDVFMVSFENIERRMASFSDVLSTSTRAAQDNTVASINNGIFADTLFMILCSLGILAAGAFFSRIIVLSVQKIGAAAQRVTEGDLNAVIEHTSSDEFGQLSTAFNTMVENVRHSHDALIDEKSKLEALQEAEHKKAVETQLFIDQIGEVLNRIAQRDLTARVRGTFASEHESIKNALNNAFENLGQAFRQVASAVEQVSAASEQISSGSQSLSEGASRQASSLDEITRNVKEVSSIAKQTTASTKDASTLAAGALSRANEGTESMHRLSEAISKIKSSSDATAKIVKTIDEIAFQTNLLALNAAVEAARAGDAGKGFAVVADEVRNLAMRSAEAAKTTASMIEDSVKNSETGVHIHREVLQNLQAINAHVKDVSRVMESVAAASEKQMRLMDGVEEASERINDITQQNAANAEESASAAEELSAQASEMNDMVNDFKLSERIERADATRLRHPKRPSLPKSMNSWSRVGKTRESSRAEDLIPFDEEVLNSF